MRKFFIKKEDVEKYIANLSPELQGRARACKNIGEIRKLIAENNIELPDDILETVSGGDGGCMPSHIGPQEGDSVGNYMCSVCGGQLYLNHSEYDPDHPQDLAWLISYMYCGDSNCVRYNNALYWVHFKDFGKNNWKPHEKI